MAALFALAVMSLTWMALIAVLVMLEKLGPWPCVATAAITGILVVLAVAIVAAPHDVPALIIPGASHDTGAMKAMASPRRPG